MMVTHCNKGGVTVPGVPAGEKTAATHTNCSLSILQPKVAL